MSQDPSSNTKGNSTKIIWASKEGNNPKFGAQMELILKPTGGGGMAKLMAWENY
jgi:hypothetical protein